MGDTFRLCFILQFITGDNTNCNAAAANLIAKMPSLKLSLISPCTSHIAKKVNKEIEKLNIPKGVMPMKIVINIVIFILILIISLLLSQLFQKMIKTSEEATEMINYFIIGVIALSLWTIIAGDYKWFVLIIGLAGFTISLYYLFSKLMKKH